MAYVGVDVFAVKFEMIVMDVVFVCMGVKDNLVGG